MMQLPPAGQSRYKVCVSPFIMHQLSTGAIDLHNPQRMVSRDTRSTNMGG